MKKILLLLSILFALSCVLISCGGNEGCEHDFTPATCNSPKTCTLCGETEGTANEHSFEEATCKSPKTCEHCGITEGEKGEHIWEINCLTPSTCKTCGAVYGPVTGHDWTSTICTEDKTCRVCGEKKLAKEHLWNTDRCLLVPVCMDCDYVGSEIAHNYTEATCLSSETCTQCGEKNGAPLGHNWKVTSCKSPKICQRCNEVTYDDLPHQWIYKGCEEERQCSECSLKEGLVYGHNWIEATCELSKNCLNCKTVVGEPLGHNWKLTEVARTVCEGEKEIYFCNRCKGDLTVRINDEGYGYHICDTDGLCIQCNQKYDTSKMTLESVLITNEHSVECCGIFTSTEALVKIYKPVTYKDVGMPVIDLGGILPTIKSDTDIKEVDFTYDSEELSFACIAEIKVQGASSAGMPKKNFNIKLFNADGSKNKIELYDGWGEENKYCMKANYIDFSQSRNVVSGKIFGEIVKSRNDELIATPNGGAIDGYPILVYNNGVYQGIYTMNIPKDKWMFGMHDSDEKNQAIFMAETWNNAVSFREVSTNGFVLEYASNEDSSVDNNTQWAYDSMLDLIEFVYNNDGEDFKNGIHQYADIDKCIDSMLYTFFICADDNTSKNILWVTLDGKVWFSSMYDMDGTWGMRWNGNIEFNENTLPISALVDGKGLAPERNHSKLNLLWERIYVNYYDRVCERYWELRQEILTVENITNHFEAFFFAIPDAIREAEKQKWTGVPTQNIDHLEQILTFAEKRIEVMDKILIPQE